MAQCECCDDHILDKIELQSRLNSLLREKSHLFQIIDHLRGRLKEEQGRYLPNCSSCGEDMIRDKATSSRYYPGALKFTEIYTCPSCETDEDWSEEQDELF